MNVSVAGVRWVRVLVGAVAAHLTNALLIVLAILFYVISGTVSGGEPGAGMDRLTHLIGVWGPPVLAFPAAVWASRGSPAASRPLLHGLLVGLLVAPGPALGLFGPPSPLLAAITLLAGMLGGLAGRPSGSRDKRGDGL